MMLDLLTEVKQPMEDAGWITKVLIGALFTLAGAKWYLFPVSFLAYGYIYQVFCSRFRMEGEEKLPDWKDWKELFIHGLVIFLIALGYLVIPIFAYLVANSILMGGILAKMVGLIFMAGTALLFVAALFFLPMGIARYTLDEKFSAAFTIREIWNRIMNIGDEYFKITVLGIVVIIALSILGAIPTVGPVLSALLGFYAGLVMASIFGKICRSAFQETDLATIQPETE